MADGFDMREFDGLTESLVKLASEVMPKQTKAFMTREANKLKKRTLALAQQRVNEKTGYYFRSIKRGRAYFYMPDKSMAIRVYSNAPHAHLIEYGHRVVTGGKLGRGRKSKQTGSVLERDGKEVFVEGKHVFEDAQRAFQSEYFADCEKFVDKVILGEVKKRKRGVKK